MIKGAFTLVTNSGELEVPFLFRVETAASVQVLTTLNSAEDFAELAKKDMDMALRLMEYRDFTDAPFLKDLRIRTIYEGLKGHGNRQNALEEFFLALTRYLRVELTLSAAKKTYEYPSEVLTDKITLRKNTWGYIYIELKADGDFIELGKRVITQADFENDRMDLRFKIHPERMHKGKNLGAIHLLTAHGSTAIQIEAIGDSTIDITGREHEISKAGICRYMKLREQYEASGCTDSAVLNKIQKELDAIRGAGADSIVLTLYRRKPIWTEAVRNWRRPVWRSAGTGLSGSRTGWGRYIAITSIFCIGRNRPRRKRKRFCGCSGKSWAVPKAGLSAASAVKAGTGAFGGVGGPL